MSESQYLHTKGMTTFWKAISALTSDFRPASMKNANKGVDLLSLKLPSSKQSLLTSLLKKGQHPSLSQVFDDCSI